VAALLHLIPYLGTGLFLAVCFLIGLVSLDSFWPAIYLTLTWLTIQFIIGFGLASYIQSRSARINSAALFVGFLLFGWLWGGWGLIVAAPVLAALKAVTDRVVRLKDISTLMS
jgi:predicted PurR-regulated permease PerM